MHDNQRPQPPDSYFEIARLDDGRYCVQFIKRGAPPRTSYTARVGDVVRQVLRAGHLPVRTRDDELRRACRDEQVVLLD
ncbi:MAG TPA: hypothetical protein VNL77_05020 [Roseiflexaceae bacterium]|nr:hypothetical protein [Roseiflexaceae bacterium]